MNNETTQFFACTWGWEQTNVTFYMVLKKTEKTVTMIEVEEKTVTMIEVESAHKEWNCWGHYTAMPTTTPRWNAKPIRRKLKENWKGLASCRVSSFQWAELWDGKAVKGTSYA